MWPHQIKLRRLALYLKQLHLSSVSSTPANYFISCKQQHHAADMTKIKGRSIKVRFNIQQTKDANDCNYMRLNFIEPIILSLDMLHFSPKNQIFYNRTLLLKARSGPRQKLIQMNQSFEAKLLLQNKQLPMTTAQVFEIQKWIFLRRLYHSRTLAAVKHSYKN